MKSKSVVLMIVSLGFGLIAAIGISQVMGNSQNGEATIERGQVIVAAKNLSHGDDLTEETCKIEHWPLEVIPEAAARSFEQIKHKKIATRLTQNLPIMLSDTKGANEISTLDIPKGFKVVAIKASAEDSNSGLLRPGDRVDVIGVVQVKAIDPLTGKVQSQTVSETFMKNIEVFSVNGNTSSSGPREAESSGNVIIGVLVNEKQSELVVLVQKVAKLRMIMRGESDNPEDDENEISDYQDFHDAVYGEQGDLATAAPQARREDADAHATKVWTGDKYEVIKFRGSVRVTATKGSSDGSGNRGEFDDYGDYDQSDEIESGLEEDQYPGR